MSDAAFAADASDEANATPFEASNETPAFFINPRSSSNPSVFGGGWRLTNARPPVMGDATIFSATAAFAAIINSATTRIIGTSPLVNTSRGTPSLDVSKRSSADASSSAPRSHRAALHRAANAARTARSARTLRVSRSSRKSSASVGGGFPSRMACAW